MTTTALPPTWQAHHHGLHYLAAHGLEITTATTIAGPCEYCESEPAIMRVYGDPHPDFADMSTVLCEQVCEGCGPWIVATALRQQVPWSTRPIQVELQEAP